VGQPVEDAEGIGSLMFFSAPFGHIFYKNYLLEEDSVIIGGLYEDLVPVFYNISGSDLRSPGPPSLF
jgi:hypothetical protein